MSDDFWKKFEKKVDKLVEKAADQTDEKLSRELSSITKLTQEEIQDLFPKPSDVKRLSELIRLVKEDTERNEKINKLVENSEKFADIVLTLVSKLA